MSSLLNQIAEQGQRIARAEQATRDTLKQLEETNLLLLSEVKERRLAESRLRILCDTMTSSDLSIFDRIARMLKTTCESFGFDAGILAKIEDGKYTVIQSWTDAEFPKPMPPGTIYELTETYCKSLDQEGTSIGIDNIGESDWKTHPLYIAYHIETYLGVCVRIRQKFWGALCFVDLDKREKPFIKPDHDFIRLMSQWIGAEMSLEKQQLEL